MADLTSHEAPAHQANALPVMLPPGKLIGRDLVLARVYSQLKENKPVLVYGASGIGKTALAATLASAYTGVAGGVLWLNVNNTPFPELLARIGRAYNLRDVATSDNPITLVSTAMNAVTSSRPLVVFDGQVNAQAISEFIMRCTDKLPILLVNETEISGPWTNVPLGILEADAAATMFKNLAPEQTDGLPDLMAALDDIPFAIAVAAGAIRARKQTPAAFLAALPKSANATAPLRTLTASFSTLTSPLQGLLLLLGSTLRGETSVELFSLIANAPEDTVMQALNVLAAQHLVERFQRYGRPYYRLHIITHTFAQTWLRGTGRLEGLQNKARDAVLAYARKFSGTPDRLAAEMDNFLAVARWAADQGDRDVANQLAVALMQAGDFVNSRGYVYELLMLRRLAASSTTAFPAYGDQPAAVAAPLPVQADEDEDLVEVEDGESPDDLDLETEDEEAAAPPVTSQPPRTSPPLSPVPTSAPNQPPPQRQSSGQLAATSPVPPAAPAQPSSQPPAAPLRPAASLSLPITDEDEDEDLVEDDSQPVEADIEPMEDEEEAAGEPVAAPEATDELAKLRAALNTARQQGNRARQAELQSSIAQEQVKRGQETEAITSYSDALNTYEALNDQAGLLSTLEALASLTAKTENSQAAVLHAQRGIDLAEDLRNEPSQRNLLTILGDARQQLGESDDAISAYSEALDLARASSDKANEALILYKLAYAQLDNGEPDQAIQSFEDALTLFREQGRRDYEGRTLAGLGTASGESEHWPEAIKFYTSALYIAREMKDSEEEMLRLSDLGRASVEAHQLGQAVLRYRQALHLAYRSNNRENIVSTTVDLARLLVESQRHLNITNMLVEEAMKIDPNDRDLKRLQERIQDELEVVPEELQQAPVAGTAQDYAANAYSLLDNP
ncbi:MAG TPA: tetratricopeptide repeat protein [Phototrophicaceae bacterium]|nr:tetratricopeptide repeat protein [Phototrophicaceae bacterium]